MWIIGLRIEVVTENIKDTAQKKALYTSDDQKYFGILNIKRFVMR